MQVLTIRRAGNIIYSIKHRPGKIEKRLTLAVIYRGPGEPWRTLTGVRARDVRALGVDPTRADRRPALVDVHTSGSSSGLLRGISGRAGARIVAGRVGAHGVGTAWRRVALVQVCVSGHGVVDDAMHNNIILFVRRSGC